MNETFSDGNFTTNPVWSGDVSEWQIASGQLQSNGVAATGNVIYLSTPSTTAYGQWEFFANPKVSTTSGNYMEVHLISDVADLESLHNGYFVRIGNTDDEAVLYRLDAGDSTVIIDGPDGIIASSSDNPTKVKVTRDVSNVWTLYVDVTGTGANYVNIGTATDAIYTSSSFFGVLVKHSAANNTKYLFDDLYAGALIVDNTPPEILSATVISSTQIDVQFSEPLEQTSAETEANYTINNTVGNPETATLDANTSLVHLTLSAPLGNQSFQLIASNIADLNGNVVTSDTATFSFYQALAGDIIINELLPDPDPIVGLPNAEFVELYNTTTQDIDITGWIITDGSSDDTIPSYVLPANSFVILTTTASQSLFASFGTTLGVSSFPSLNNTGDNISLKNQNGVVIDNVAYTDDWYNDAVKQDGGWSLELINPLSACGGSNNWLASTNTFGGTPGTQNSIYDATPDNTAPQIISAIAVAPDTIVIQFNEILDSMQVVTVAGFDVIPFIGNATYVSVSSPEFNIVTIAVPISLSIGNTYTVNITNIGDCSGNIASLLSINITLPDTAAPNDLVVNEILFNPASFGFDYVELYNRSDKTIDVSQLKLWNTDEAGELDDFTFISDVPRLIPPQGFLLITEDTAWVLNNYFTHDDSTFVEVTDLPSYNDDVGTVILTNAHNTVIDKLSYNEDWHYALLEDRNGIALERISPDAPTQDSMNWHSAATAVGYGTPGLPNSQEIEIAKEGADVVLQPKVFSPDGDGYNDVLSIAYYFNEPGFTVNIKIFNEAGALVKDLVEGRLAEPNGFATWDGTDSQNERASVGAYVVWIEAFNPNGSVKQFKRTCVLAGKKM